MVIVLHSHSSTRVSLTVTQLCRRTAGWLLYRCPIVIWIKKPPNCLLSVQSSNNLLLCCVQMSQSLSLCARAPQPRESHLSNLQYDIILFDHWPWAHNCGWEVKHQSSRQFHTPLTLTYEHNKEASTYLNRFIQTKPEGGNSQFFKRCWRNWLISSHCFSFSESVFVSFRLWMEVFWTHHFYPLV